MSQNQLINIYVTCHNEQQAAQIASGVVSQGLAACANIVGGVRSIYRWQGDVQDDTEVAILFKTRAGMAVKCMKKIEELHPYENPCIEVWPVAKAIDAFEHWIIDETGGERDV